MSLRKVPTEAGSIPTPSPRNWPTRYQRPGSATPTYGISLAGLFPGTITLARQHLHVTAGVTGFFLVGSSLGAMALPWLIGQFFESVGPQVFPAFITSAIAGSIVLPAVTLILLPQRVTDG